MASDKRALLLAVAHAQQTLFSKRDSFIEDVIVPIIQSRRRKEIGEKRARSDESSNREIRVKRTKSEQIQNYVESIAKNYFADEEFKSQYRMYRATAEALVLALGKFENNPGIGRPQYSLRDQCLLLLWVLANQESYKAVAERFRVSKATVFYTIQRVAALLEQLAPQVIKWPDTERAKKIVDRFKMMSSFPSTIGVIDATRIAIIPPNNKSAAFIQRKGHPTVILQSVCDHKCRFTHVHTAYPDSSDYSRVYRSSELSSYGDDLFPFASHLVGDSSYPICPRLMTPYRDDGILTARELKYNAAHSQARATIRRTFGLLKSRWRRMHFIQMHCSDLLPKIITSACVLHNWCLFHEDELDDVEPDNDFGLGCEMSRTDPQSELLGMEKRAHITNEL